MGLLDLFRAAPKAVDNVLDKDNGLLVRAGGFINDLHYSDQEKAKAHQENLLAFSEWFKTTLSENTERSKTRRDVAVMWIKAQLALVFMTILAACLEYAAGTTEMPLATFIASIAFGTLMTTGTLSVIAFFFGPYMFGSHLRKPQPGKQP